MVKQRDYLPVEQVSVDSDFRGRVVVQRGVVDLRVPQVRPVVVVSGATLEQLHRMMSHKTQDIQVENNYSL